MDSVRGTHRWLQRHSRPPGGPTDALKRHGRCKCGSWLQSGAEGSEFEGELHSETLAPLPPSPQRVCSGSAKSTKSILRSDKVTVSVDAMAGVALCAPRAQNGLPGSSLQLSALLAGNEPQLGQQVHGERCLALASEEFNLVGRIFDTSVRLSNRRVCELAAGLTSRLPVQIQRAVPNSQPSSLTL